MRPAGIIHRARGICLLAFLVAGCTYDYAPVRVEVRDRASYAPVADAAVRIANTRTLNPKPPAAAQGVTDDAGAVTLEVAIYNNLIVRVTPPGEPTHVFSAEHPAFVGPSGWLRPIRTVGGRPPKIEIRLVLGRVQPMQPSATKPPKTP